MISLPSAHQNPHIIQRNDCVRGRVEAELNQLRAWHIRPTCKSAIINEDYNKRMDMMTVNVGGTFFESEVFSLI